MITMPCCLAMSCINFVVGPSGIFSTASYQRVCCSAQKYGVVKTSCMQRICTPCFAASSIIARCFSMFRRLISSIGASVGLAFFACINPHLTVRAIIALRDIEFLFHPLDQVGPVNSLPRFACRLEMFITLRRCWRQSREPDMSPADRIRFGDSFIKLKCVKKLLSRYLCSVRQRDVAETLDAVGLAQHCADAAEERQSFLIAGLGGGEIGTS